MFSSEDASSMMSRQDQVMRQLENCMLRTQDSWHFCAVSIDWSRTAETRTAPLLLAKYPVAQTGAANPNARASSREELDFNNCTVFDTDCEG
jgi:hypothetical protein